MRNMLRPALVLAIVVFVSGENLEGQKPKAVKKLNTFVVEPKNPVATSVAPVLSTAQLPGPSEPPQLLSSAADEPPQPNTKLSTKTIYGFLNFVTTVGNTVMVFTPGAATEAGASQPETAEPAPPASVEASPSRTTPAIVTTASEPLPQRHLRFTSTEPAPSTDEQQTTPSPPASRRQGKNLLWAKLRDRSPKDRRPFVLPQRRGLQTARSAAARPTPPLPRQFLSAAPASVVPDDAAPAATPAPQLGTHTVGGTTSAGLKTIQAGEETSSEDRDVPTEPSMTRVSSVIQGSVTEFPQLPSPAAEPEVVPIERLLSAVPQQAESERRPPVQSLQERLKARLQAALASRPSRRPFTLVPEQRARSVRPDRPELPLSSRRSPAGRDRNDRRLSAGDRLRQRLLKQRKQTAPSEEQQQPEEADEPPPQPTEPQQQVMAVNTYRPKDASDFYYELTTLKSLHHNTLGRFTSSMWLTSTETRTVRLRPTATQRAPPVPATARPGLFGGLTPSAGSGIGSGIGSGKVVMLPAVQLDPSSPSLPLNTMTETYSTTQLLLQTSVIPLVIGDSTQAFTLTQSYQVTRLVTALKTMPPMEVFQRSAPPGLLHRERPLLASGSENQVDELGVPLLRVPPPDDLAAIGLFDVDLHESQAHPEEFQLQRQAAAAAAAAAPSPTPALPPQLGMFGALGGLGGLGGLAQLAQLSQMTPQQLAYLRLLGPIFPALQQQSQAGLPQAGLQQAAPRTIVTSSPVVYSTLTTSVHSRAVVVTFRATPSTAYITSTTVFNTVVTSYVTSTMQVQAPAPLF